MAAKWKIDPYLLLLVIAIAIFVTYWVSYANYKYITYASSFYDTGQETYSMYLHLHNPGVINGLQFLSFSNHISLFKILLLPLFAIYQSPLTLVFLQDLFLSLSAIVIYFIGKDVLNNRYVGFALGLAFLISAGVRGVAFFDIHVEAFIPLFYLLSFYFYMRKKKTLFFASYLLMLSTLEAAPFLGFSLIGGLLFYELVYNKKKTKTGTRYDKDNLKLLGLAAAITLIFALFYYLTVMTLLAEYQAGAYSNMPTFVRVVNFFSIQSGAISNPAGVQYSEGFLLETALFGFLILFLGFGLTGFRNIILTMIFVLPWVIEVMVLHNVVFDLLYFHYYADVIGGAVVAAVLGFLILSKGRGALGLNPKQFSNLLASIAIAMAVVISIVLLFLFPSYQSLFPNNWQYRNYSPIDSALSAIPLNTSVMAQSQVATHLYKILYLELPPNATIGGFSSNGVSSNINIQLFYTRPEYIVVARLLSSFLSYNNAKFNVYTYMGNNYSLYNSTQVGRLSIYKSIQPVPINFTGGLTPNTGGSR